MKEAEKYIEQMIGRGIEWYDYQKLDKGRWQAYFNDADNIIRNETFNNEFERYKAELIKFCATMDGTPLSTDKLIILTNVQFAIVALDTFKEHLKSIIDPRKESNNDNPYDPI